MAGTPSRIPTIALSKLGPPWTLPSWGHAGLSSLLSFSSCPDTSSHVRLFKSSERRCSRTLTRRRCRLQTRRRPGGNRGEPGAPHPARSVRTDFWESSPPPGSHSTTGTGGGGHTQCLDLAPCKPSSSLAFSHLRPANSTGGGAPGQGSCPEGLASCPQGHGESSHLHVHLCFAGRALLCLHT